MEINRVSNRSCHRPKRTILIKGAILLFVVLLSAQGVLCQSADAVRGYVREHQQQIAKEYLTYLSIPNLHGDIPNLSRNADLLMTMLEKRNLAPELWKTSGAPIVFGQKIVPGAQRTLLFYIHYDGQPVDLKRWKQPDPFVPVVRTESIEKGGQVVTDITATQSIPDQWRIYARAAGDDKVPIEALLVALDALGGKTKQNIKVILHGEEEGSGPSLDEVVRKYPDKLKSDLLIILDGPQHPSGKPTIYYGARGGAGLDLTVYTAAGGMHSGNYGNWMPDANVRLAQLLSSMVSSTGKVVIDGFYSDVLPFSPAAVKMMQAVPDDSKQMQLNYGVGSLDGAASSLQEGLNLPTFSVHMMKGGEVGGVIPATSSAQIAMRLVKENDPGVMVQRVIDHIRKQGYFVVTADPDLQTLATHSRIVKITSRSLNGARGSGAWRTDPDDPQAVFATKALEATAEHGLIRIRTLGGGVPASTFIDAYHVPTVGISIANYDDNQHTDNENLRFGNLWDGVVTLAGLLTQ